MDTIEDQELAIKSFIIALWAGGYPHEIICFLLRHLIVDDSEDNHLDSSKIEKKLSSIPLKKLIRTIKNKLISQSKLPSDIIDSAFFKIEFLMDVKLAYIIKPADKSAKNRWKKILHKMVGETTLQDYFGSNPEQNINYWAYSVKKRIIRAFFEGGWKDRSLKDLCIYLKRLWFHELEYSN